MAWPLDPRVTLGWAVPSRRNVTVPVGVPAPGATAATVAVKVTAWPNTVGLGDAATVMALLPWFTVTVLDAEVLLVKVLSPPYSAVIEWLPTLSVLRAKVAVPLPLTV